MSISYPAAADNPAAPAPPEPLTAERRRAMTRRHLLDAAAHVFARAGFHRATLDDVAATAGFTKGAVYSNWRSKDDLFVAVLDDRIDRQLAVVGDVLDRAAADDGDDLDRIRLLLQSGAVFWDESWSALYLEFVVYARRNPQARAKLAAAAQRSHAFVTGLIAQARDRRVGGEPRHDAADLAHISLALFEGLAIARLVDPDGASSSIVDTVLAVLSDATDARRQES